MTRCGHLSVRKQKQIADKIARSQGYKDHKDALRHMVGGKVPRKKKKKAKAEFPSSREYGGDTYWLHRVYGTKMEANSVARNLRRIGWNARIAKARDGWGVYRRKRIKERIK